MEKMRNEYEEKLDKERAVMTLTRRDSEANVQALRRPWMQSDPTMQNNFQPTRIKFEREVTKGFKGSGYMKASGKNVSKRERS